MIFVGCPTHDGRINIWTANRLYLSASRKKNLRISVGTNSLLNLNCNHLLQEARASGDYEWIAFLHSDVEPDANWVDTLLDVAEEHNADMVSAIVAVKDRRGLTSTALMNAEDPWSILTRLTLTQINDELFPKTFDTDAAVEALAKFNIEMPVKTKLVVNTGCCIIKTSVIGDMAFQTLDRFRDGKAQCVPEDWYFSYRFSGKIVATTKVKTIHRGTSSYQSDMIWGQEKDEEYLSRSFPFLASAGKGI